MSDAGLRIIIGASSQVYPHWLQTQRTDLDLTSREHWAGRFEPGSVSRILAEHVWEHLTPEEADTAAAICHEFLEPGGFLRCAVPDRLFPNAAYQSLVQVGGPGPADHPAATHQVVYTHRTLVAVFERARFQAQLLEWWDETGAFHVEPWDERDGFIYRSKRFDHRNQNGVLGFTSLIVDAIKPPSSQH